MKAARILMLAPLLAVAVVSFVFVRLNSGTGTTFINAQQHAQALTPAGVDRVVRAAPDPVTGAPGLRASCVPLGKGELLNPWRCVISYRSGRIITYTVQIRLNGSYGGGDEIVRYRGQTHPDTGQISGCCIVVP